MYQFHPTHYLAESTNSTFMDNPVLHDVLQTMLRHEFLIKWRRVPNYYDLYTHCYAELKTYADHDGDEMYYEPILDCVSQYLYGLRFPRDTDTLHYIDTYQRKMNLLSHAINNELL